MLLIVHRFTARLAPKVDLTGKAERDRQIAQGKLRVRQATSEDLARLDAARQRRIAR